jgi:hypothetical protein
MRFGRQLVTPEARIYNPGDEFRTDEFGNRESFLMPAHDKVWTDPHTREMPESIPGVMRLRPRGHQDAVNREIQPPVPIKVQHKTEEVLAWLLGDDGISGKAGGAPRFLRELSPSDQIDAEADARVIEEARRLYLAGRITTAEMNVRRHEARNAENRTKNLPAIPPSALVKKDYELLASLRESKGSQCPQCGEGYADVPDLKTHIDRLHPDDKNALYTQAGIKAAETKRKYQRKAVAAA